MTNETSCKHVRDLLPLYVDNVCSEESKALVEEHLKLCDDCRNVFEAMSDKIEVEKVNTGGDAIKKIADSWKKDKRNAFENGILIAMLCAIIINIVSYYVIGSTVLDDGTFQEPFFLIPLSYIFAIIGIVMLLIKKIRNRKKDR